MRSVLCALVLATIALAAPPGLDLPKEVRGDPSAFVRVQAKTDGKTVRWLALDPGLYLFPVELLKDSKTAVVTAARAGRYRLLAVTAAGDEPSEPAVCTVVIGEAPAPPTPPGPTPPGPTPQPVGTFDRVLILFEDHERAKLPRAQDAILTSSQIHDYLKAKTAADKTYPGGAWRIWDKDVAAAAAKPWSDYAARPRTGLPWVILANEAGVLHEGPLPADVGKTIELLDRHAVKAAHRKAG